jgi:hypothetical protein
MSSKKVHLGGGLFLWLVAFLIYYFVGGLHVEISLQQNALWIGLSIWMAAIGALMPDWDLLWQRVVPHRHIITHSIITPLILCSPLFALIAPSLREDGAIFLPLYACFLLGYASHLLLDLVGTRKWVGGALIKYYKLKGEKHRAYGKLLSKFILLVNGLVLLTIAVVTMFIYIW